MKRLNLLQVLLVGALLTLAFPTNIMHVSAAPTYSPGVKPGDEASYANVTAFAQNNVTQSVTLNGAGSTFVFPLVNAVSSHFTSANPSIQVNYQALGSGVGVTDLIQKTTDFSASDRPLTAAQQSVAPDALHIPDTVSAVVVAYNSGTASTGVRLDAATIARIFQGQITNWNDTALKQLNPTISLPNAIITVVHRSDSSGTTFVFTSYLNSSASGVWTLGQGNAVPWPVGIGAPGNQGEASLVQSTPFSIGYVELNYAISNNLPVAYLQNADGNNFVQPSLANVVNAVTNASSVFPMGNQSWASVSLLNEHGTNTYPIASFSYLLVHRDLGVVSNMTLTKAIALANFLSYIIDEGQQIGTTINYAFLPPAIISIDRATVLSITFNGFSLLPRATISIQPNAIVDLNRSMKQIMIQVSLSNTPDVPSLGEMSVQVSYDPHVLTASNLDYSGNVFANTGFPPDVSSDCLDGLPANNGPIGLCGPQDGPGFTTFAETLLGGSTADATQGNIFNLTLNVNTTSPQFSQIRIAQSVLGNLGVGIPSTNFDGYYTSLACGVVACSPSVPSFALSPRNPIQGIVTTFDASSSIPSPGAVITDYFWTFGDASLRPYRDSGTTSTTQYEYQLAGHYLVTLTITDSNNIKTSKTLQVAVTSQSPIGIPPLIAEFLHVQTAHFGIQSVSGNNVTAVESLAFDNGTGSLSFLLNGDLAAGSGNLRFWVISSGLTTGDPIYNIPSPTINSTDTELVGGAQRTIVHLSLVVSGSGGRSEQDWGWDQATGILVSISAFFFAQTSTGSSSGYLQLRLTSTNLWPGADFGIQADPTFLTIQKSSFVDPFALGVSTVSLMSLSGFSGTISLTAVADGVLGTTFASPIVSLTSNSTATSVLSISAANTPPGTYHVIVTGNQFTGPAHQHSVTITVQVVAPPPDFQIYVSVPFGGNFVFAGSSVSVGVQLSSNGQTPFIGNVSLTGQVTPTVSNGPTTSFNPAIVTLSSGFGFSQLTVSTTGSTPPGNYTITVTGTSGTLVHTAQFQLTVASPPVLTVSPSSGPVGTQVTVHGSGFVSPFQFSEAELEMTFDDQLMGLFFIQGSSFNFTFNVPLAQPGVVHSVHAKELYPTIIDVQTSFLVQPQPNALTVTVSTGTVYFPGDAATIFVSTSLNGQPTTVTSVQVILVLPTGTNSTLPTTLVSPGFYKATYLIPTRGSIGTYAVIVKANQSVSGNASALGGFEVKQTWLQANGRNVITATGIIGAVGTLGVLAISWRKGIIWRRKAE